MTRVRQNSGRPCEGVVPPWQSTWPPRSHSRTGNQGQVHDNCENVACAFGSGTARDVPAPSRAPAPGYYESDFPARPTNIPTSSCSAGFRSQTPRFQAKDKKPSPGPGTYNDHCCRPHFSGQPTPRKRAASTRSGRSSKTQRQPPPKLELQPGKSARDTPTAERPATVDDGDRKQPQFSIACDAEGTYIQDEDRRNDHEHRLVPRPPSQQRRLKGFSRVVHTAATESEEDSIFLWVGNGPPPFTGTTTSTMPLGVCLAGSGGHTGPIGASPKASSLRPSPCFVQPQTAQPDIFLEKSDLDPEPGPGHYNYSTGPFDTTAFKAICSIGTYGVECGFGGRAGRGLGDSDDLHKSALASHGGKDLGPGSYTPSLPENVRAPPRSPNIVGFGAAVVPHKGRDRGSWGRNTPGPGAYEGPRSLAFGGHLGSSGRAFDRPASVPPGVCFGSHQERFGMDGARRTAGYIGAQHKQEHPALIQSKMTAVVCSALAEDEPPPDPKTSPGPGSYNVIRRRGQTEVYRQSPYEEGFLSTATRFQTQQQLREMAETPGPGSYDWESDVQLPKKPTTDFAAAPPRFAEGSRHDSPGWRRNATPDLSVGSR
mmetsp:Transcript_61042/g.133617  ORF Transcript_61042/g.133617 Transcript_61042/m.133617 type:complete len:597 (-) Transcript_61042:158-1948(-)